MKDTRCNSSTTKSRSEEDSNITTKSRSEEDSNIDSIVSISSEESDEFEEEDQHKKLVPLDIFGEDLNNLFRPDEGLSSKEIGISCFSPPKQSEIPSHLKSFIEECGLV